MSREGEVWTKVKVAEGTKQAEKAIEALRELDKDLSVAREHTNFEFDVEQAFIVYATLNGDIVKSAAALGITPDRLMQAEVEHDWRKRLGAILRLKETGRPGDVERAVNRACNFAQASRMRTVLDRMVTKLFRMSDEELLDFCFITATKTVKGIEDSEKKISTRPFADLASALEKVQALSYMALGDSAVERKKREDDDGPAAASTKDIHAMISQAVADAAGEQSPRSLLHQEQKAQLSNVLGSGSPAQPPGPTA
jgi:hypothetical protein